MKQLVLIVIFGLAILIGGWIAYQFGPDWAGQLVQNRQPPERSPVSEPTLEDERRDVFALGRLQPADGLLTISAVIGDRLRSLEVGEGEAVTRDQRLGYLESHRMRELELQLVESQFQEAAARRDAEESLADARITGASLAVEQAAALEMDIEAQAKQIELLEANLAVERKSFHRLEDLPVALVSEQERERRALAIRKLEAELGAAQSALKKMRHTSKLTLDSARADLVAARANKKQVLSAMPLESLQKRRQLAQEQLDRTILAAPSPGVILKIYTRPGELIERKPVLQMANLERMICVAEVYETDVRRVHEGQTAVIRSRAFAPPLDQKGLRGTVTHIGRMISTPDLTSLDPFARADRHVVEVRIAVDEEDASYAAQLVNLQVDVLFLAADDSQYEELARSPRAD